MVLPGSLNPNCCPVNITPTATPSITPTKTPTQTVTPTHTATYTNTPTATPTNTNTPSVSPTCTITPSNTPSNTPTVSITATHTSTPTNTVTQTITPSSPSYGILHAYGLNRFSQLTNNFIEDTSSLPYFYRAGTLQKIDNNTWDKIAAGNYSNLGIKLDGSLWAWGDNYGYILGYGGATQVDTPMLISSDSWIDIAISKSERDSGLNTQLSIYAGYGFGIKNDNTLWAWGNNENGQLGDGTLLSRSAPDITTNQYRWKKISAGKRHTLGIRIDNVLMGWGSNIYGVIGDGTTSQKVNPVVVLSNIKSISCGKYHNLALTNTGVLYVWGDNTYGQLGRGFFGGYVSTPTPMDGSWIEIAAGEYHSLGIKSDGSLWGWGNNTYGQLGDGTTTNRNIPTSVYGGGNWKKISTGGDTSGAGDYIAPSTFIVNSRTGYSAGIKSDGSLWHWGSNAGANFPYNYEISNNGIAQYTWKNISVGADHLLAINSISITPTPTPSFTKTPTQTPTKTPTQTFTKTPTPSVTKP